MYVTDNSKATGFDGVSVKVIKVAKSEIVKPITKLINKSICNAKFPDNLKEAQVVPLHKKNSQKLETIDLLLSDRLCRSSSRGPYTSSSLIILKIFPILICQHLGLAMVVI